MYESVPWLVNRGDYDKCEGILKSIAKTNGKVLDDTTLQSFKVKMCNTVRLNVSSNFR